MQTVRYFNSSAISHNIRKISAVHKGNAFEERALRLLRDGLSMSLKRVGGKSDGGVDLQGWWWLPPIINNNSHTSINTTPRRRLRVLAQCKAEKKKFSPNYVREMEGVLHRYMFSVHRKNESSQSDVHPYVALLLSESPFTSSTLLRAQSSPIPFFLLHLPPADTFQTDADASGDEDGQLGSAFWNPALGGQHGVLGGQIEARWERAVGRREMGRPGLWWQGKRLQSWTPDDVDSLLELKDDFV